MLLDPKWQKSLDSARPTAGFRSAKDLGISDVQRNALIQVLALMEGGKMKHVPDPKVMGYDPRKVTGHFNMNVWQVTATCGSVCCIGGTAELLIGKPIFHGGDGSWEEGQMEPEVYDMASTAKAKELDKLFFPPQCIQYEEITDQQAAKALRNYLTSGTPRWAQAMAKPKVKKVVA